MKKTICLLLLVMAGCTSTSRSRSPAVALEPHRTIDTVNWRIEPHYIEVIMRLVKMRSKELGVDLNKESPKDPFKE